ncbi:DAK2 domain-containing protein [Corynebacterium sp. MSK158]|uniref:DAK2 domain-containing protein n=1 Tax=Corynebacterium sp. MSK158 TaxID=3050212 RepID=UPI002550400F|nr:DAK2 domain-containing protein [Corynebacterium sp. MSK158]MDK8692430.1 DAK2 domain-containing protein [Corynebacterium sp. MSK158]
MSYPSTLDSHGMRNWATRAVGELAHRRDEINALNVFPVPDSDTGSNMAHTMEAAVAELDNGGDVADSLAIGAVRGARGNSGMVLSQVLRGIAESTVDSVIDGAVFARSLQQAVELVDRAIAEPVEGTVITVLKAAAEAADDAAAQSGATLHSIVSAAIVAAETALERTPSQLPALREAGVVDAGGAGLVILLESFLAEIEGSTGHTGLPETEPETELEVVFFFEGDLDTLQVAIEPLGDSLVIARATEDSANVHIHSWRAGKVIETAFATGKVTNLHLEVLPPHAEPVSEEPTSRRVFAAAPAGPITDLLASAGVSVVSPDDSIAAADEDIVLATGLSSETGAGRVVPAQSLAAALAAISVYEPDNPDTGAVVAAMRDAAKSMRVAYPSEETPQSIIATCRHLLAEGGEQVTVLSALDLDQEDLAQQLRVDVMALKVPDIATEIGVE